MRTGQPTSRKPTWRWKHLFGILAVAVVPFMVIHLTAGTALAWLGRDTFLGTAIVLLVIFMAGALVALIYGFTQETPQRQSHRGRRGSV